MSDIFSDCSKISSLPDISKWNTNHLENNYNMFEGCNKLVNKPIIEIKKERIFWKIIWIIKLKWLINLFLF